MWAVITKDFNGFNRMKLLTPTKHQTPNHILNYLKISFVRKMSFNTTVYKVWFTVNRILVSFYYLFKFLHISVK